MAGDARADDRPSPDASAVASAVATPTASRFPFGRNWAKFLRTIDAATIGRAQRSLVEMLEMEDLTGRTFLDVGCGSGLFSLAARESGAAVVSFDFDAESVACAVELRRRFRTDDPDWTILSGSILDVAFLDTLGTFDIVYAWGVLHHTGRMQTALENTVRLAGERGLLYVAIYNDQGRASRRWNRIKQLYNRLPRGLRWLVLAPALGRIWGPTTLRDLARGRPFATWREYPRQNRGMSPWRDVVDWVGGFPFEVARPEQIVDLFRRRGFALRRLRTCGGGRGCNEFVFERLEQPRDALGGSS
jgi:SAM-dependent methyltransferase